MAEYRKKNTINELISEIDFDSYLTDDDCDNQDLIEYLNQVNRQKNDYYLNSRKVVECKEKRVKIRENSLFD